MSITIETLLKVLSSQYPLNLFVDNDLPEAVKKEAQATENFLDALANKLHAINLENKTPAEQEQIINGFIQIIKLFFELRWRLTYLSGFDYLEAPFTKVNQRCAATATAIREPDEAIAKILMFNLTKHIKQYSADVQELKEITENNGQFQSQEYLLSLRKRKLYSILEIMSGAKDNTGTLFKRQGEFYGRFKLAKQDILKLRTLVNNISPGYFDRLYEFHLTKNKTLHGALIELVDTLFISYGNELIPENVEKKSPALFQTIKKFHEIWYGLSDKEREQAGSFPINIDQKTLSLNVFLNALFIKCGLEKSTLKKALPENEKVSTLNESDISSHIPTLTGYLDLFCNTPELKRISSAIPINASAFEKPNFDAMHVILELGIPNRCGNKNQLISDQLELAAEVIQFLSINLLELSILPVESEKKKILAMITSIERLDFILARGIYFYFGFDNLQFINLLFEEIHILMKKDNNFLKRLLDLVPMAEWPQHLKKIKISLVLPNGIELKKFLTPLPEGLRVAFIYALGARVCSIIKSQIQLINILKLLPEEGWPTLIANLSARITSILPNKQKVESVLVNLPQHHWKTFMIALSPYMEQIIQNKPAYTNSNHKQMLENLTHQSTCVQAVINTAKINAIPKPSWALRIAALLESYAHPGLFSINLRHGDVQRHADNVAKELRKPENRDLSFEDCWRKVIAFPQNLDVKDFGTFNGVLIKMQQIYGIEDIASTCSNNAAA